MDGIGEVECVLQFCEVFDGFDGAWDASASDEAACWAEGFFEIVDDVAELGGFFELEFFSSRFHIIFQTFEVISFAFSFEEGDGSEYAPMVVLLRNFADAGCAALADDIGMAVAIVVFTGVLGSAGA